MINYKKFITIVFLFLSGCEPVTYPYIDDFAYKYVVSIYEDTEFYKEYTIDEYIKVAQNSREYMTEDFELELIEFYGCIYQYSVYFSNGNLGSVNICLNEEDKSNIKSARFFINRKAKESNNEK